jgi:hypothetical protein
MTSVRSRRSTPDDLAAIARQRVAGPAPAAGVGAGASGGPVSTTCLRTHLLTRPVPVDARLQVGAGVAGGVPRARRAGPDGDQRAGGRWTRGRRSRRCAARRGVPAELAADDGRPATTTRPHAHVRSRRRLARRPGGPVEERRFDDRAVEASRFHTAGQSRPGPSSKGPATGNRLVVHVAGRVRHAGVVSLPVGARGAGRGGGCRWPDARRGRGGGEPRSAAGRR